MGGALAASVAAAITVPLLHKTSFDQLRLANRDLQHRPFALRISNFPYSPANGSRGPAEPLSPAMMRIHGIAGEILAKPGVGSSEDQHVRAIAELIAGNAHGATKLLESGVAMQPDDARLWSDLAVARFESARQAGGFRQLAAAFGAAATAVDLDSKLREARFNHALALEALGLYSAAADSFQRYLVLDGESGWASEARAGLARCNRVTETEKWKSASILLQAAAARRDRQVVNRIVAEFPEQSRAEAENVYLCRWGETWLSRRTSVANESLAAARLVGIAVRERSGESLLADSVAAIDYAHNRDALAQAYVTYRAARIAYSQRHVSQPLAMFSEAEEAFRKNGSPMSFAAEYYGANALHDANDTSAAFAAIERLLAHCPARYRVLRADASWLNGTLLASSGRLSDALMAYDESRTSLQELGEHEDCVRVTSMALTVLSTLGRGEEAWQLREKTFRMASDLGNENVIEAVIGEAARDEIRAEHWDVGRSLFEVMAAATESPNPRRHTDSQIWIALADWHLNQLSMAAHTLANARASASKLDTSLSGSAVADIDLAESITKAGTAPSYALWLLDRSAAFMIATGRVSNLSQVFLQRARCYKQLNRTAEALADYNRAIAGFEARGSSLRTATSRDALMATASGIYEELTELLAERGEWANAFTVGERSRGRAIAERLAIYSGDTTRLTDVGSLSAALPENTVLLQFTAAADHLIVIALDRHGVRGSLIDVRRSELSASVTEWKRAIADDRENDVRSLGTRLYDHLMGLLGPVPPPRLILAPDDTLAGTPFAALTDKVSGHALIEESELTITPSAAIAVRKVAERKLSETSAQVFGDPSFDTTRYPGLPPLLEAQAEAVDIGKLYGTRARIREEASASAFLKAIRIGGIVHVAAHAVANEPAPSASALLFTPDASHRGEVTVAEIAAARTSQGYLAVLAGCGTGIAPSSGSAVSTFAAAFLACGYPVVVGTLWNVDDSISRELSVHFHERLRRGTAASAALRAVQIEMLRSSDTRLHAPRAWSGVEVFGAAHTKEG